MEWDYKRWFSIKSSSIPASYANYITGGTARIYSTKIQIINLAITQSYSADSTFLLFLPPPASKTNLTATVSGSGSVSQCYVTLAWAGPVYTQLFCYKNSITTKVTINGTWNISTNVVSSTYENY